MVRANVRRSDVSIEPAKVALACLLETHCREINDVIEQKEDAFSAYLNSVAGQEELEAEKTRLNTWGHFAGTAIFFTSTSVIIGGLFAAAFAGPVAVVVSGWTAYYGAVSAVTLVALQVRLQMWALDWLLWRMSLLLQNRGMMSW